MVAVVLVALAGVIAVDQASQPPAPDRAALIAIAFAAASFHEGVSFPGWRALFPVFGASALIVAGPHRDQSEERPFGSSTSPGIPRSRTASLIAMARTSFA